MKQILFVLFLSLLLVSCTQGTLENESIIVMSWNVQNLMDGVTQGNEYSQYKDDKVWNEKEYLSRLIKIGKIINSFKIRPDILLLQEIENSSVAKDLIEKVLYKQGFLYYATAKQDGGAISVGLLSKIPIEDCRVHSVENQRPVLEADFDTAKGKLIIFAVHGASRLAGIKASEVEHTQTIKVIKQIIDYRREGNSSEAILIAGDFNTDTNITKLKNYSGPVALKIASANSLVEEESFCVSGSPVMIKQNRSIYYSFWLDNCLMKKNEGSYYYDQWFQFDNILCNSNLFDGFGWEFKEGNVLVTRNLISNEGLPWGFNLKTKEGVSDHLPVWVELK